MNLADGGRQPDIGNQHARKALDRCEFMIGTPLGLNAFRFNVKSATAVHQQLMPALTDIP